MDHFMSFDEKGNGTASAALLLACGLAFVALAAFWVALVAPAAAAAPVDGALSLPPRGYELSGRSASGFGLSHHAAVAADIEIEQFGPQQNIAPGGVTSYTIRVRNNATTPVSNLELLDTWSVKTNPSVSDMWEFGVLPEFQTYTASIPDAVTAFTHTVNDIYKRGEATWEIASLPGETSFEVVFTLTLPITTQPTLKNYEQPKGFLFSARALGPTLLDNSAEVWVGAEKFAAEPWTSVYVAAPLLDVTMTTVGETVGVDQCRIGRLVTYSIAVANVISYEQEARPDGLPASNLTIFNQLPSQIQGQVMDVEARAGVTITQEDTYIQWVFPPTFVLTRGETTHVTFTARVPTTTVYYPGKEYLETEIVTFQEVYDIIVHADGMPFRDAALERTYQVRILSPFDKGVTTTSPPTKIDSTYTSRPVTYTLTFYNPSHRLAISDLMIEDQLYETFTYSETRHGPSPTSVDGSRLIWEDVAVTANGAVSVTFVVYVGAQTPVKGGFSCSSLKYPNAVTATTSAFFPNTYIGHDDMMGGGDRNELAPLTVEPQLKVSKDVEPDEQIPGEVVTYTIELENVGDTDIPAPIVITDRLPSSLAYSFFYSGMVGGPVSDPIVESGGTVIIWNDVPTVTARGTASDTVTFSFQAIVYGVPGERYANTVEGYSPETSICTLETAKVKIGAPIGVNKTAQPTQTVQGETFSYTVRLVDLNPSAAYTLTKFWDILDQEVVAQDRDRTGLINPLNGSLRYTYTLPTPFHLAPGGDLWSHTFPAQVRGFGTVLGPGANTWCDDRLSDPAEPIEQPEGHVCGTVVDEDGISHDGSNVDELAPLYVRPHVSLIQQAYPNPVAIGSVVTIVLTLRDNRTAPVTQVTGVDLQWTLPHEDFTLLATDQPTSSQDGMNYVWEDLAVPKGGIKHIVLRVRAPWHREPGWSRRFTADAQVIALDQPSMCIPRADEFLVSDSGTADPGGALPWALPAWGDEKLVRLEVNQGLEVDKEASIEEIGPYGLVEYAVTVENLTGAPVSSVVFTDILPYLQESQWTYVKTTAGDAPYSEDPLAWRLETIPPQDEVEFSFAARASSWLGGAFNDFEASAPIHVGPSKYYTRNVMVYVVSGVGLFKEASPNKIQAGESTTYTITLYNGKQQNLAKVTITDTLPVSFTFESMVSSSPAVGKPTGDSTLVWELPASTEIEAEGGTLEIVFRARTAREGIRSGTYYNQVDAFAVINAGTSDEEEVAMPPTGQTAPVFVESLPMRAEKTAAPGQIMAGESVTYTITLYSGPDYDIRDIVITDTLPVSFTFEAMVSSSPAVGDPTGDTTLVWTFPGTIAKDGGTLRIVFTARADETMSSGTYYNHQLEARAVNAETQETVRMPPTGPLAPVAVESLPRVDLTIMNPRLSSTELALSETLRISMTVYNSGTLAITQDFDVAAYVRDVDAGPPTATDHDGQVCQPRFTSILGADAEAEVNCSTTITQAPGTYTFYGQVDVTGAVDERYEHNNLVTGPMITITMMMPPEESEIYLPLVLRH